MFHLTKPAAPVIDSQIADAENLPVTSSGLMTVKEGLSNRSLPFAFAHDRSSTRVGEGERAFAAARAAFQRWAEFDLGWVSVANADALIVPGQIVAVQVHIPGLWSLNLSRIIETIDTNSQFGFLYATTPHHAEQGEERFVIEYDPTEKGVWYLLEAVSRPRHILARVGYPVTRALQHRFARESQIRMKQAITSAPLKR